MIDLCQTINCYWLPGQDNTVLSHSAGGRGSHQRAELCWNRGRRGRLTCRKKGQGAADSTACGPGIDCLEGDAGIQCPLFAHVPSPKSFLGAAGIPAARGTLFLVPWPPELAWGTWKALSSAAPNLTRHTWEQGYPVTRSHHLAYLEATSLVTSQTKIAPKDPWAAKRRW